MSIDRKIGKLIKLGKLSDNTPSSINNSNINKEMLQTNGNKSSGTFSFSNNQNSIPNLFEEHFEESNSEPSSQPSSIKHIVLKYKLSENDFLFDSKFSRKDENNFVTREAIILASLMNFDLKQKGEEHKTIIEFIPQEEKPNPMELNLYRAIDGCVKNKLKKTNKDANSENKKCNISSCANLGKLAFQLKNNHKSLEFIAIKAIMISMINLMNEIISTLQIEFTNKNTLELDGEIFTHIYKQFLIMSNICPYIENDFSSTFELFRSKYQLNFTLSELFSDIYWDVVFSEKHIRLFFIRNFNSDINEALKGIFNKIVNALWLTNFPLKRQISELLDIKKMLGNRIDLASCIVEEKENSEEKKWNRIKMLEKKEKNETGSEEIEKEDILEKERENEEEKGNKLEKEVIIESHVQDKEIIEDTKDETTNCQGNIVEKEELKEDIKEEKQIIPESEKNIVQEISNNNMIIDNNISISSNSNKNREKKQKQKNFIQDHKSIEEIYNYIVNANDESLNNNNNNGKRKNKKKNKRKKSMNNNISNKKNDISNEIDKDPVVEQFKSELCGKVVNAGEIQKIKPMISSEWIQKITFNA